MIKNYKMPFLPDFIDKSWNEFLNLTEAKEKLEAIQKEIETNYFPEEKNVLRFMNLDIFQLKYIIVGMDPYPSDYDYFDENKLIYVQKPVATGRSFEVGNLDSWLQKYKQASLRNILKTIYYNETGKKVPLSEVQKSIIDGTFKILPPKEWFNYMEKQGIMFLNATLTVKPYTPGSHEKYWENFMQMLIEYLNSKNKKIIWVLWGNNAYKRFYPYVSNTIVSPHPRVQNFIDHNCFHWMPDIDWTGYSQGNYDNNMFFADIKEEKNE